MSAPVEWIRTMFAHDFIAHAFLAGTAVAVVAGLVGYFVVLRNQVFVADAQSHVAYAGAMAALAFGGDVSVGLFSATVAGSVTMGALGGRSRGRDVAIGTTFAWILGLGVLFDSLYTTSRSTGNGTAGVSILFGSVFGLSGARAWSAVIVSSGGLAMLVLIARPLLFASADPDVAAARGVPVRLLGTVFMALVGVTVGEAVQVVGALLIFGLMVTPALTAQLLTARPYRAMWISTALGAGALWIGLTVSYVFPQLPPSFAVVMVSFAGYLAVVIGGALRAVLRRRRPLTAAPSGMLAA